MATIATIMASAPVMINGREHLQFIMTRLDNSWRTKLTRTSSFSFDSFCPCNHMICPCIFDLNFMESRILGVKVDFKIVLPHCGTILWMIVLDTIYHSIAFDDDK
jgi:hypothetical protein